jgi:putative NIF3 family GTP cyclohydrolase 1 type 2
LLPATATGIRVSGDFDAMVSTVAVCGGAGDSLLSEPEVLAADVYVTSDLRHHPASEARENARLGHGPALIDVSHWASEWLWLEVAASQLRDALPGVSVEVSELRTDPWDFVVTQ